MIRPLKRPADSSPIRVVNLPRAVEVVADERGLPLEVVRRGRQRVTAIQDVWRIDDEWWREPISRRYFRVLLDGSEIRTIYHDLINDEWFEQWY